MIRYSRASFYIGSAAAVLSIFLWCMLHFFNPYTDRFESAAAIRTFFLLFLPACAALVSVLMSRKWLMLAAFIWSLPASLYLALTPGVFALFGATSIAYIISYLFMRAKK
ncbi:hypothetical protein GRF59_02235 [Paenibacillus sp. HJL G12]|uniref:Uncharacterized protein n=1 Tax=Paenibacillus dendrobii TaxID=2691084 RepID=A0A7X3LGR3_9BACL|nr:hypothetical protein [Paenibacillus dendrobii]MWV42439.1 hypothetical protein [Paenibacillus dendrobii]